MRSSKISRDTARLFDQAAGSNALPRRATRSLSRFSYSATNATSDSKAAHVDDIEDAVTPPAKRRRKASTDSPKKTIKAEPGDDLLADVPPKAATPRKQRKPARKATDPDTGETTVEPPSDWERMYELVRKMRAPGGVAYGAAVDTMGCERLADRQASPKDQRFHTLVALMLSSQTKDTTNAVVMKKLQTELPAHKPGAPVGLNLDNMLAVEPKLLNELIWAVGFHNNKTKYVSCITIST